MFFTGIACSQDDATSLRLIVDTDYDVPAEADRLELQVRGPEGTISGERSFLLGASPGRVPMPLSITVVPKYGDSSRKATLTLSLFSDNEKLVELTTRRGFLHGKSIDVPIFLQRSCEKAWMRCGSANTCIDGACDDIDSNNGTDAGAFTEDAANEGGDAAPRDDAGDADAFQVDPDASSSVQDAGGTTELDAGQTAEDACTPRQYFRDSDRDGYGDSANTSMRCEQPSGYVGRGDDCRDDVASVHPGAVERCDGLDNDCDERTDEGDGDELCDHTGPGVGVCSRGRCTIDCSATTSLDCNFDAFDGCETTPAYDPENCGGCGIECESGEFCNATSCRTHLHYGQECPALVSGACESPYVCKLVPISGHYECSWP